MTGKAVRSGGEPGSQCLMQLLCGSPHVASCQEPTLAYVGNYRKNSSCWERVYCHLCSKWLLAPAGWISQAGHLQPLKAAASELDFIVKVLVAVVVESLNFS